MQGILCQKTFVLFLEVNNVITIDKIILCNIIELQINTFAKG